MPFRKLRARRAIGSRSRGASMQTSGRDPAGWMVRLFADDQGGVSRHLSISSRVDNRGRSRVRPCPRGDPHVQCRASAAVAHPCDLVRAEGQGGICWTNRLGRSRNAGAGEFPYYFCHGLSSPRRPQASRKEFSRQARLLRDSVSSTWQRCVFVAVGGVLQRLRERIGSVRWAFVRRPEYAQVAFVDALRASRGR